MRVKLALLEPFPSSKVLLPVPDFLESISQLKKHIIKSLSSVAAHASKAGDLTLEIDGFELLGKSTLNILQDGDVVSVKLAASTSSSQVSEGGKKRKPRRSEPVKNGGLETKRRRIANGKSNRTVSAPIARKPAPTTSSSSTSESESDESSTSTSSSSTSTSTSTSSPPSSSSSSSASSSDADSDSPPDILSSARPGQASTLKLESFPVLLNPKPLLQSQSAPGQGLARTKNRNARKRKAIAMRKMEAGETELVEDPSPPNGSGPPRLEVSESTASQPQGIAAQGDVDAFSQYSNPRDMANRNKKKGFLKDMAGKQSVKTLFEDASASRSVSASPNRVDEKTTPKRWKHVPVVPPSEQEDLPSNVFVTSKEYDWRRSKTNSTPGRLSNGFSTGPEHADEEVIANKHVGDPVLGTLVDGGDPQLWEDATSAFDSLPAVTSVEGLDQGMIIAWKELELDVYTFSPQLMLRLATVVFDGGTKCLRPLQRPQPRGEEWQEEYDDPMGGEQDQESGELEITSLTNQDLLREPGKYRVFRTASSQNA